LSTLERVCNPQDIVATDGSKGAAPKYKQILLELRRSIDAGEYRPGERMPSEADFGPRFGVSRLTIQRVLKELQIEGLIERKAGSGTYVKVRTAEGNLFGLLVAGLGETEIFDPICQGIARAGTRGGHALLWGDPTLGVAGLERQALNVCLDYISRGISGVFFAPIEGIEGKDRLNQEIIGLLDKAKIPVILLDRCIYAYPRRSRYDVVGIDNRRAGHVVTQHLLAQGARAPVFLARTFTAPTVDARIRGFFDATSHHERQCERVVRCEPSDVEAVREVMARLKPDGFVCANDMTAAKLMHSLEELGHAVPQEVRIVGIDDVRYAKLLRVPLTTLRQPCLEIGETAVEVMLSRVARPELPARDILLDCELIIRDSCGESAGCSEA
jgi:GntR family transcriptional regulator of arabinose operon